MAGVEARLRAAGVVLPRPAAPVASYLPVVIHGGLAHVSGQLPRTEDGLVIGQVGRDLGVGEAKAAAELCAVALFAALKAALAGDLDQVAGCIALTGFVHAVPGFTEHSEVINGASDLMLAALEDAGRHARAAAGVASLPFGVPVEVSGVFALG